MQRLAYCTCAFMLACTQKQTVAFIWSGEALMQFFELLLEHKPWKSESSSTYTVSMASFEPIAAKLLEKGHANVNARACFQKFKDMVQFQGGSSGFIVPARDIPMYDDICRKLLTRVVDDMGFKHVGERALPPRSAKVSFVVCDANADTLQFLECNLELPQA